MKTPLILLATTLLIAGCSTASNQIDNYSTESHQSDSLIQSKEQLLNYVKEVESAMSSIKEVNECDQFTDENLKSECVVNLAFSESELGNKSLCKNIDDEDLKLECQQLSTNQDK